MNLSGSVISELAHAWIRLHGPAAEIHLSHMVETVQRSGDSENVETYQRILDQVGALRTGAKAHRAFEITP
jgi:hypothetical protein